MALITLSNDHVEVVLDPDRGGEIQSFVPSGGVNALAYHDWEGPLSAERGPSYGSTELDWLSRYNAGWQSLFPNAGAECMVDGVPVAFHGEASFARMRVDEVEPTSCQLTTWARLPLRMTRTVAISAARPALLVRETVENIGAGPVAFIWGHHPTFPAYSGAVIDTPGTRVVVEAQTPGNLKPGAGTWPRLEAAEGGTANASVITSESMVRLLYLTDLGEGWVALRNEAAVESGSPGIAMAWDLEAYPHMWMWLQNGDSGFPWYGRARMIGLEPQRSWPFDGLAGAIERGQAVILEPGTTTSSWITLAALPANSSRPVTGVSREGVVSTT